MLIKDILDRQKNNVKVAMIQGNRHMTYVELNEAVMKVQAKIDDFLCHHVAIFLPNSIEYVTAYFAITSSDKVIVPIPIQAKKDEIESTLQYCEIGLIITSTEYLKDLQSYMGNQQVVILNIDTLELISSINKNSFLTNNQKACMDDTAIMLHTSGTTSDPKRVMLSHKNLIANIESNIQSLNFVETDVSLIGLPMFFGYCNTAQMLTHFYLGATIVILENLFTPNKFFKLVEKHAVTNFTGVPSMLLMLLDFKRKEQYDISTLRFICFGGGHISKEKLVEVMQTFSTVDFIQTYGQTEAAPRVTCLLAKDATRKLGSIGKPIPHVSVRIVDEDGRDVAANEIGELIVKGPNVMRGYYKKEEVTKETIKNAWLHTGDYATFDEEGFIYLIGRKKNMIISGGINIYPEEIEELIMNFNQIKEVCVVSEKHEILGEVPIAKVVVKEENVNEFDAERLHHYCYDNLAVYKVPTRIEVVETLPKTKTGKIKRNLIKGD